MSFPALFMWLVVFAVGVPSAWVNPTAAALVISWIASEVVFVLTGNNLPVQFYLYPDLFVIAVIVAKPEWCNLRPYTGVWHQLKCILLERSLTDRIILSSFPVMWCIYVADIPAYSKWWMLYGLAIFQFLAASAESIEKYRRTSKPPETPSVRDNVSRLAWGRGYG